MIASAFGQKVSKGIKETGWHHIHGCMPEWYPLFPEIFPVFHWHEETFDLPQGATRLAEGVKVKNQAFIKGSAIGIQFHPEVTMKIVTHWTLDLPDAERDLIINESHQRFVDNRKMCFALMDAFVTGWKL